MAGWPPRISTRLGCGFREFDITIFAMPIATACYVHTPFRAIQCAYCSFFSDVREEGEGRGWLETLVREVAYHGRVGRYAGRTFETVFLGGGTPTALSTAELERLFAC